LRLQLQLPAVAQAAVALQLLVVLAVQQLAHALAVQPAAGQHPQAVHHTPTAQLLWLLPWQGHVQELLRCCVLGGT
jgi:hypothetical protein